MSALNWIAFELVAVNSPYYDRILVIGSQHVKKKKGVKVNIWRYKIKSD